MDLVAYAIHKQNVSFSIFFLFIYIQISKDFIKKQRKASLDNNSGFFGLMITTYFEITHKSSFGWGGHG